MLLDPRELVEVIESRHVLGAEHRCQQLAVGEPVSEGGLKGGGAVGDVELEDCRDTAGFSMTSAKEEEHGQGGPEDSGDDERQS